ncbi:hypothetical protein D3C80_1856500 [compost metagenome]
MQAEQRCLAFDLAVEQQQWVECRLLARLGRAQFGDGRAGDQVAQLQVQAQLRLVAQAREHLEHTQ